MSLIPSLFNAPLQTALSAGVAATPKTATATGSTTGASSSSSASSSSTDSIGSTFLSLLVQELQNQDPTAPMDSTAMVGQMISLNQLDQLTSINQVLSNASQSSSTATSSAGSPPATGGQTHFLANSQAISHNATQAALRLLSTNAAGSYPAVASSVTLPAF